MINQRRSVPPSPPRPSRPTPPTPESAKKAARDALKAAGVDVDDAKVTTESFDGATQNVRFQHVVDGVPVDGYETYVGVGPDDEIISASGYVLGPRRVGTYTLATLARAVERLNESSGNLRTLEARDTTAIAPGEPNGDTSPSGGGSTEATVVKLTSVKVGLMMQSDYDGDLWLVPAYQFGTQDNGRVAAAAADDKYIEQPPAQTTPKPVDGGATEPGAASGGAYTEDQCEAFSSDNLNGYVCMDRSAYKAGEAVTFRISATDDDRGFSTGPCFDGVTAAVRRRRRGDVRCEACSTDVPRSGQARTRTVPHLRQTRHLHGHVHDPIGRRLRSVRSEGFLGKGFADRQGRVARQVSFRGCVEAA